MEQQIQINNSESVKNKQKNGKLGKKEAKKFLKKDHSD
jgi:hypothetical protein